MAQKHHKNLMPLKNNKFVTMHSKSLILIFLMLWAKLTNSAYFIVGPAQTKVLSYKVCPEYKNQSVIMKLQPHMFNKSAQIMNVDFDLAVDIDDNIKMRIKAVRIQKNKSEVQVFGLDDVGVCTAFNKYAGILWHDFQVALGMKPGTCPIKKGRYHAQNWYVDLTKTKVQLYLAGHFRHIFMLTNGTVPIFCVVMENEVTSKDQ